MELPSPQFVEDLKATLGELGQSYDLETEHGSLQDYCPTCKRILRGEAYYQLMGRRLPLGRCVSTRTSSNEARIQLRLPVGGPASGRVAKRDPSARDVRPDPLQLLRRAVRYVPARPAMAKSSGVEPRDYPHNQRLALSQRSRRLSAGRTIRTACSTRSMRRRGKGSPLERVSWDEALDYVAGRWRELQAAHGRDAVAVYSGSSMTNEKCYLMGKFARVGLGTRHIDYNGRLCMSSAAVAYSQRLRHRSVAAADDRHPAGQVHPHGGSERRRVLSHCHEVAVAGA